MRLVVLNTAVERGGGITATRDLVAGLAERGWEVSAAVAAAGHAAPGGVLPGAARVERLPASAAGMLLGARRLLGTARPQVVLADRRVDVRLALAARLPGAAPPVVHRYGAARPLGADPLTRLLWRRVACMVLNSEAMRRAHDGHPALAGIPRVVIHNGKDLTRFRPDHAARTEARAALEVEEGTCVVWFHGILQDRKNVDLLLQGAARLPREAGVEVVIAGSGREEAALRRLADELAVPARFLGFREPVERWIQAADVAVNLSLEEGFANAVVEALACGVPVVATRATSHPEQVRHGETGLLLEEATPQALAAALGELAGSPARRAAMGAAAREDAEARFGLAAMLDAYDGVLRRVARGEGAVAAAGAPA